MSPTDSTAIFEERRGMLLGLAYRILGTRSDAEDAVQDTYLKWRTADHAALDNPGAWLTTTCTRRCLDILRSAHKSRVAYVGAWLPEPLETPEESAESRGDLASSLTTAFLLVLERLTPKERAAYLLHEIFEIPHRDVARSLEMEEAACRKLVSRARANVNSSKVRCVPPRDRQDELLAAFTAAIAAGDATRLAVMLSSDVELAVDSGGKVPSLLEVLKGKDRVVDFVVQSLHRYWLGLRLDDAPLNGGRGIVVRDRGEVVAAVSFAFDEASRATRVFIMRNPDKLARLQRSPAAEG